MTNSLSEAENLVGQNPRDLALLKIMELKKDPASTRTRYYYKMYAYTFLALAERFFGLKYELIRDNFDQKTIKGLEELITQKAKKWSLTVQILMYGIPILGWIFIPFAKFPEEDKVFCSLSYRFFYSRKKLTEVGANPICFLIQDWQIKEKV